MKILNWIKENWITAVATTVATVATGGTNLIAVGIAFGAGYLLDADRNQREKENKQLELAGKAGETIRNEVNNLQIERNKIVQEAEELVKELQKHRAKMNDPNATLEEKDLAKRMIPIIQSQLDEKEKRVSDLNKKIDNLLKNMPGVDNKNKSLINLEMDYQTKLIVGAIVFLVIYFAFIKEKER